MNTTHLGPTNESVLMTIAKRLQRGEVGFLFGAGMSYGTGICLGPELSKRMLRCKTLGVEKVDQEIPHIDKIATSFPFEAIAELCSKSKKNPTMDLLGLLQEIGGMKHAKLVKVHEHLLELYFLLGPNFPRELFTTNFDPLIENALNNDSLKEPRAITVTTENLDDLHRAKEENKIAVVHLHGCISHPKSIICGEMRLATLEGTLLDLFKGHLSKDVFVFVGYSLSDTNLRYIFFDIQRESESRNRIKKDTFVVSPADGSLDDDCSEVSIIKSIWGLRGNVTHLPLSAEDFFYSLNLAIRNSVLFQARELVAQRLGTEPKVVDHMLESATADFQDLRPEDLLIYLFYVLTPLKVGNRGMGGS
jgi:hypothetical protein